MPGAIRESGNRAVQIVCRALAHSRSDTRCAKGHRHISDGHSQAQGCHCIVAPTRGDDAAPVYRASGNRWGGLHLGGLLWAQHGGQHNACGGL